MILRIDRAIVNDVINAQFRAIEHRLMVADIINERTCYHLADYHQELFDVKTF